MFARIKCLFGSHERSRRDAVRYADNTVLSQCKHCGKPMFRHPREGWQVERRSQQRCLDPAEAFRPGTVGSRPPLDDETDAD